MHTILFVEKLCQATATVTLHTPDVVQHYMLSLIVCIEHADC